MTNRKFTSLKPESYFGFGLEDMKDIILSIDRCSKQVYDIESIINPKALQLFTEQRAIAMIDGTNRESLGYEEIINRIKEEVEIQFNTYMYYVDLHKYYSRVFSIEELCNLRNSLEVYYSKTHFMNYFPDLKLKHMDNLTDRLNKAIIPTRDLHVTAKPLLDKMLADSGVEYGIQHRKMWEALRDSLEFIRLLDSEDAKYEHIYNKYLSYATEE